MARENWWASNSQFDHLADVLSSSAKSTTNLLEIYRSCRFFEWSLDVLRQPCLAGQEILSDNGRNLSSVLYAICQRAASKKSLLSWVQELTPMDAVDFEFPVDSSGKMLRDAGGTTRTKDDACVGFGRNPEVPGVSCRLSRTESVPVLFLRGIGEWHPPESTRLVI